MNLHHEADNLDDLLRATYQDILSGGHEVESTKGKSLETVGASLVLRQPRNRISRTETRYRYVTPLAELCWYLSGSNRGDAITPYLPRYAEFIESDGTVYGGYGPRIFGDGPNRQVHNAIGALRKKQSSRRVVLQILDKGDMCGDYHKDIPCTNTMQFLVRNGKVYTIVSMRSNDAWFGLIHDVFAFTMLQELVARDLGLDIGTYTHFVGSLHLYKDSLSEAQHFVDEGLQATTSPMDPMPEGSPWSEVEKLVEAERVARAGASPDDIPMPDDGYWRDLASILVSYNLRKAGRASEATHIESGIRLQPIRELLARKTTRGPE